ncbi:uncharacterized protein At1g26090, chloroplastic isoform X2 [Cornus florida]|uniref:uncharacterized protein At1g26090, chloroplastic isoform X2 n=1 Tax=Cornus florida TaxID=4283 RepID=UPI00289A3692|nr:uncharacterized protein At1g26090, chloroplastic isoform X2 [Cornus florida]
MASNALPLLLSSSSSSINPPNPNFSFIIRTSTRTNRRRARALTMVASSETDAPPTHQKSTKLVTFLGKGGSGKTTSAVFAAQMLLEPLNRLKQADAHLNLTQGVLEGVVGEELGILPGMDTIFSALALERLLGFFENVAQRSHQKDKFDIVIYDGLSTEETIRMIGAASKARLYLKYMRNLAERSDLGRLASPSLLRLADEALSLSSRGLNLNGKLSSEIWDTLEQTLERGSCAFAEPHRFGCYLVMDPNSPPSVDSALRYWGCIMQAGVQVSGAFGIVSPNSRVESTETVAKKFSPMPFAFIPHVSTDSPLDWSKIMLNGLSKDAQELLTMPINHSSNIMPLVKFDQAKKSVTLLMPGFDKSEIKLYQFRGGSELLVEAGDQRRVIHLPSQIQGKVAGAKFMDRSLTITMR